jgi:putative hydrolase
VRRDSTWLPGYVERVRSLRRDGLAITCGVEAKILDSSGALDLPSDLAGVDYVLIADHQYPGPDGPQHPDAVRDLIARGQLDGAGALDRLVSATVAAIERSPLPPIVAHLFSLLPKIGVDDQAVTGEHLRSLATACSASGTPVEINEKWRSPSARVLRELDRAGVVIVAGSDAHRPSDVGRWRYVDEIDAALVGSR